jgi:hypothetical protein
MRVRSITGRLNTRASPATAAISQRNPALLNLTMETGDAAAVDSAE